ncbi:response regulator [Selenihalanaerobacter shriftii]|uniref:Stage 0 sporulation protein A homolog n=1 Tax=Selenihalanaerobacter shriftii TaxID=142842 RepID=A0A1T4PTL8_9FIRM|nr:response regulator [Selenihalanaerobacter shriftii]SJZ94905.1 two-component system, chemotaxis family, response regulator CheY [Selenihalanaerobacter shriftii]
MEKEVLIVDDASFMRLMISDILNNAGFKVVGEARSGAEAIKLYEMLKPDLVTMDISMPDKDGVVAVKEILKIDSKANILICSAIEESIVIKAIKVGAKDFIVKPFHANRLLEAIDKIFN